MAPFRYSQASRGVVFYYHNDHLGTPQVMTDITGNVVWKADYEPFGKVNIVVENIENNIRFPGQYYISETGLYYNWWRWYKSETGRYMEPDFEIYRINNLNIPPQDIINHISLVLYSRPMIDYSFDLYMNFSWNNYIYSSDNPINMFDIDGEKTEKPKPPDFPPKNPEKPKCVRSKVILCFIWGRVKCCLEICYVGGKGVGGTIDLNCDYDICRK
jgi:RHS repeat-associated protein